MANPLFPNGIQGLADSKHSGVAGSVYRCVGIDTRQTPGITKAQQALVKDSSTTVDELCNEAVKASDGSTVWFSSESGKVWREVSGTYTLVYTTVPTSGDAGCTGAMEYDGNIYWASEAYVHKVPIAGLGDTWSDVVTPNFGEFANGTDIHPMTVAGLKLLIADGTDIAKIETPTLDPASTRVETVGLGTAVRGILIGTYAQPPEGSNIYPNLLDSWSTYATSGTSLTKEVTTLPGYDKGLIVLIATWTNSWVSGTPALPTSVTFDGDSMASLLDSMELVDTDKVIRYSWYKLTGISAKTADVVATWSGSQTHMMMQVFNFDNIHQTTPIAGLFSDYTSSGAESSLSITATDGYEYCTLLASCYTQDATHTHSNTELINVDQGSYVQSASVSTVGGGFFDPLTNMFVRAPERITDLAPFDIDVLIGTQNVNKARVLRWDTVSDTWSAEDTIDEPGVNAFIHDDNFVYASIGNIGRLYYYDGEKMQPYKRIPGEWSPTKTATINRRSVGFLLGVPVFGVSNVAGNPALQGVYGFGSYSTEYNKTLSLDFPTPDTTFAGLTVGAIITDGADMWVAYKDATVVGVAKLDYNTKYDGAYIETRMLVGAKERSDLSTIARYFVDYVAKETGTDVGIAVKTKYDASYTALTTKDDVDRMQVRADSNTPRIANLQVKYTFTCSGNNSIEVENFALE